MYGAPSYKFCAEKPSGREGHDFAPGAGASGAVSQGRCGTRLLLPGRPELILRASTQSAEHPSLGRPHRPGGRRKKAVGIRKRQEDKSSRELPESPCWCAARDPPATRTVKPPDIQIRLRDRLPRRRVNGRASRRKMKYSKQLRSRPWPKRSQVADPFEHVL